jgi:phosphatidylserine decarboxylase
MRIPFAKEGYIFIVPLALLSLLCWSLSWLIAGFLATGFFLFVAYFFRDPERTIPQDKNAIISPADGKVVEIVEEKDPFLGETFTRISIFLNVFNVHVNRVPIAGVVDKYRYIPGKFLAAFNHKASLDNEQTAILFKDGNTKIVVKQIAGLIARRIICYAKEGDGFALGQRFGLIRFGSRVDIFVPTDSKLSVKIGDKVAGGSSIIGFLPESE